MPERAYQYVPLLLNERDKYWNTMREASFLGAQIEQETCSSLTSKKCWNPEAELKTHREQGVGFSQLTRAFTVAGTIRFDSLTELVNAHPKELKGYSWNNWKDPTMQMRAYIFKVKDTCTAIKGAQTPEDAFRMCLSAYNGGLGGLRQDRLSCRGKTGCNPNVWYGHVEHTSLKSKVIIPGYGKQSPFSINRAYVSNVDTVRRPRYMHLDG